MSDLQNRLNKLTPEQRSLLEKKLREKALVVAEKESIPIRKDLDTCPMSSAQERLWFLNQLDDNSPSYNIPSVIRFTGKLNVENLEESLNTIIKRHQVLRARFEVEGNSPVQFITNQNIEFVIENYIELDIPKEKLENQINDEANLPFDLTKGGLIRAKLLQLSNDESILLLTMHHIVADGWSMPILIKEITTIYKNLNHGISEELPKLNIQYADFAEWQNNYFQSDIFRKQFDYWKDQLHELNSVINLPFDRSRNVVQSSDGKHFKFYIDSKESDSINEFCKKNFVTPFMFFLSVYQTLLFRYSGQDDFGIGTPIANRNKTDIQGLIGFFVNTLVIRTRLNGEISFSELLKDTKKIALDAFENQDVPFEMVVEEVDANRTLSNSPLFQVMFNFQAESINDSIVLDDLNVDILEHEGGTSKFDLMLLIQSNKETYTCILEYRTELFNPSTIERISDEYKILISEIIKNVDLSISSLNILTEETKTKIISEWNKTQIEYDNTQTLNKLFEYQVLKSPNRKAIVYKDNALTFSELNKKSNQLANYLIKKGIVPETNVGICLERSVELLVGILGILKAGGAYVPLDPYYPEARLNYIINDSKINILLTQSSLQTITESKGIERIFIDTDLSEIQKESELNTNPKISAQNLSYIIYTSGSTGFPKGVLIQHQSTINLLSSLYNKIYSNYDKEYFNISLNAPVLFDASVKQIILLLKGNTLHIVPEEIRKDGNDLLEFIERNNIDVLDCVPTQLKILLSSGLLDGEKFQPLISVPGGEPIDQETWDKLANSAATDFYNMYGPTECTVVSSISPIVPSQKSPTIGKPIGNVYIFILDEYLNPVSIGVTGEIYVGGESLSRGYLNKPDLTSEKFIPNNFSNKYGSRLYKTGDLGKFAPNGTIEFVGRIDQQVKIQGFRIEIGEIEYQLNRNDKIESAVVSEIKNTHTGDSYLAAFVILNENLNQETIIEEVRNNLKEQLPEYMIPKVFLSISEFPLTPNGKIDRNKLPALVETKFSNNVKFIKPTTRFECYLSDSWNEILGIKNIGINDNFFHLGGNSLQAAVFINKLRKNFGIDIKVQSIFLAPTISEFINYFKKHYNEIKIGDLLKNGSDFISNTDSTLGYEKIKKVSRGKNLPLSYAQQRIWFLEQLEPGNPAYNIPGIVRINGNISLEILENSINAIIKKHEALRTVFTSVDGKANQVISQNLKIKIDYQSIKDFDSDELTDEVIDLITKESKKSFDLQIGPLLRAKLIQLKKEDFVLIVTMHHIVSDVWSSEIFVRELLNNYKLIEANNDISENTLPIQYVDYAAWQREWLQGQLYDRQLDFWKQKLEDIPSILELPTNFPRQTIQEPVGRRINFKIDTTLTKGLLNSSKQENTTIFISLLSAFNLLLKHYTRSDDIFVGVPIANRNRAEIESLIGFFVNTLVIRNNISGVQTFSDLINLVKKNFLEAQENQDIPFEKLVDELEVERSLSYSPLFQVMFVFNNSPLEKIDSELFSIEPVSVDLGTSKFDITLVLTKSNDEIFGEIEYNSTLFTSETIQRLISHYQNILNTVKSNSSALLTEIEIMSDDEKKQITNEFAKGNDVQHPDKNLFQLISESTQKYKDKTVIKFENGSLSFSEFDIKTNKIANFLKEKGIGPDDIIGVCTHRSPNMMFAIYGIIKSGGAYLPIDPDTPKDRIDYIIRDSKTKRVITDSKSKYNLDSSLTDVIDLDELTNIINDCNGQVSVPQALPQNTMYCIYTSGSTGKPKGTLVQYDSVLNNLSWMIDEYKFDSGETILLKTPYTFDVSVWELFVPILCGATLVIAKPYGHKDSTYIKEIIKKEKITTIHFVSSMLQVFLEENDLDIYCGSLKRVLESGEAISSELQKNYYNKFSIPLFNMYGPTEATVHTSIWQCTKDNDYRSVPMGRPIYNTQFYILDNSLNPVPQGIPGELYIAGSSLARGYLNKPELTADKFIPNPFSSIEGKRLYKTGDLVKYLDNGIVDYLDRIDNQIKIRGFRIELGEIESVINEHDDINHALVIAIDAGNGIKKLVGYIVCNEKKPTISELHEFIKRKLPEYMVPSLFMFIEEFPLTSSGKINRKALPEPQVNRENIETQFVSPESKNEIILAGIWQELLNIDKVGIKDNFFELGGDSILGIQVVAKANQNGIKISPKDLFQFPTIHGLASVAGSTVKVNAEQELLFGEVNLIPPQKWFFDQKFEQHNHWNQSILLDVNKNLDTSYLERSINKIIEHHDALRMRYKFENGNWKQFYGSLDKINSFEIHNLSAINESEKNSELEKRCQEIQEGFNIESGSLFKCVYFKISEDSNRLLLVAHHLIVDGISWRILTEDIMSLMTQLESGNKMSLPPKTTSYRYWASQLSKLFQNEEFIEKNSYWEKIKKIQPTNGSNKKVPMNNYEKDSKLVTITLSEQNTDSLLKEIPKKYNTEINDVLLTALILAYSKWNGVRKMFIALEGHGREDLFEDVDISRTIGWFTSIFPVLLDLKESVSHIDALLLIKEQIREITYNGIGYGLLKYFNTPNKNFSDLPHLPEISFNYLGQFNQINAKKSVFNVAKENKSNERGLENFRPFQVDISGSIVDNILKMNWIFNSNKFEIAEIEKFADFFIEDLNKIIDSIKENSGGYTPSDFKDVDLNDEDLDSIFTELNEEFEDE